MTLRVTVCELRDDPHGLTQDWEGLTAHVAAQASRLVLLPEMPFYPWIARTRPFDPAVWQAAISQHDAWQRRFEELAPAVVIGSRPVNALDRRLNEGFVWESRGGYRPAHPKYYLPDEDGYWEASWYQRGAGDLSPIESGSYTLGFLICTELWFMDRARRYAKAGIHLLVTPRTTEMATVDKWLAGGRAAAVISGAFGLSSNRAGAEFGGQGWIIDPDGQVLGLTSRDRPFVTVEIDPSEAERAKGTYPRYVLG
jgi:N-carbamoylputrescine amidase